MLIDKNIFEKPLMPLCRQNCQKHFIIHTKHFIIHTKHFIIHTKHFIIHTKHFIIHTKQEF